MNAPRIELQIDEVVFHGVPHDRHALLAGLTAAFEQQLLARQDALLAAGSGARATAAAADVPLPRAGDGRDLGGAVARSIVGGLCP
jgi:hypothetical protein